MGILTLTLVLVAGSVIATAWAIWPTAKQLGVMEMEDAIIEASETNFLMYIRGRRFVITEDIDDCETPAILAFKPKEPSEHKIELMEGVAC